MNQFGGISSFNLVGTLSLQTLTQDDDWLSPSSGIDQTLSFEYTTSLCLSDFYFTFSYQIHPRFNKSLFENKKILALMTPVPAFPTTGLGGDGVLVR